MSNVSTVVDFREGVSRIKEHLSLHSVVSGHGVELKKRGREWVGLCPFHDERTPSFSVNSDKGVYFCRGCGETGDVISFHGKFMSILPGQAIRDLGRQVGVTIESSASDKGLLNPRNEDRRQTEQGLFALHEVLARVANERLLELLQDSESAVSRYLGSRQISAQDVRDFGLGFLDFNLPMEHWLAGAGEFEGLQFPRLPQGRVVALLRLAGFYSADGSPCVMQGRLLFPIGDPSGRVIAFSGRVIPAIETKDTKSKYRNSPESEIFIKSKVLYGVAPLNFVSKRRDSRQRWRQRNNEDRMALVEGFTDVIALARQCIFATASMGTAFTEDHARIALRHANSIDVVTDGDKAGRVALDATLLTLFPLIKDGQGVVGRFMPEGMDPDSYFSGVPAQDGTGYHLLDGLSVILPEDAWYRARIGKTQSPLSIADRVKIERACEVAVSASEWPSGALWRLGVEQFIARVTGYWPRQAYRSDFITGRDLTTPLDLDAPGLFWLIRFARAPHLIARACDSYLGRWWVNDCRRGLIHAPLDCSESLRLIYTAAAMLKASSEASVESFDDVVVQLVRFGMPSIWLIQWSNVIADSDSHELLSEYQSELILEQLWLDEWSDWMDQLDSRLGDQLLEAVSTGQAV